MNCGVLFDLDGTLWDSVDRLTPAWNRVLEEYGVTVTTPQLRALMGKTAEEFAAALLPGETPERGMEAINGCCREELIDLAVYG
ncbi:MAG: HAD family hydrolase, partial [Oscillospiraceae bacterium]|nr:HAD family hydrolase [Oscillospiraceae bacterium]